MLTRIYQASAVPSGGDLVRRLSDWMKVPIALGKPRLPCLDSLLA